MPNTEIYDLVNVGDKVYDVAKRKYGTVKQKLNKDTNKKYLISVQFPGGFNKTDYTADGKISPMEERIRIVMNEPHEHKLERQKKKDLLEAKTNSFAADLKALLEKHNAEISFNVGDSSDTYGIYGEYISVDFNEDNTTSALTNEGSWAVSSSDL